MSKEYVAGISIGSRQSQLALFEVRDQKHLLLYVEVHDQNDESPFWFMRGIEHSSKLFKKISKISVAVDSSSVTFHTFPLDTSLTQKEQQDHIHWELSNIIADYQPQNYVTDIHVLKSHVRDQTAEILTVAVQRQYILEIQRFIAGMGLKVGLIDTVYFASEYALLANYPEIKTKCVALVVMNNDRVDIGWYMNGRLTRYMSTSGVDIENAIQKIQSGRYEFFVSEVFYCAQMNLIEKLRVKHKELRIPMTVVDPMRRLVKTSMWRTSRVKNGRDYLLAACAGIALQSR